MNECVCDPLSQVVCGRQPCLLPGTPGRELHSCPGGRECLEHNFLTCLSPPCHQWGFCSSPEATPTLQTKCEPNSVYLDKSCARITLIFNKDKLPTVSIHVASLFCFITEKPSDGTMAGMVSGGSSMAFSLSVRFYENV